MPHPNPPETDSILTRRSLRSPTRCDMWLKRRCGNALQASVRSPAWVYMMAILGTLTLSQGYTEANIQKFPAQLYIGGNYQWRSPRRPAKGPKKLFKAMIHKLETNSVRRCGSAS